jgi:hypothetical protein
MIDGISTNTLYRSESNAPTKMAAITTVIMTVPEVRLTPNAFSPRWFQCFFSGLGERTSPVKSDRIRIGFVVRYWPGGLYWAPLARAAGSPG